MSLNVQIKQSHSEDYICRLPCQCITIVVCYKNWSYKTAAEKINLKCIEEISFKRQ